MTELNLSALKKALDSLKNGYSENPSELERDGIIQRFEFTLELSWKTAKKILRSNDIEVDVPKNVFREMASLGWIDSAELWMEYVNARNKASHIYNEEMATAVFSVISDFIKDTESLIKILEDKI